MRTIPKKQPRRWRRVAAPAGASSSPAVVIRGLTVTYGAIAALRDVDLTIEAGTITAVIGPNGSGKSSLLGSLSGLVAPTRGTVLIHGLPPRHAHHRVAHVLQSTVVNRAVPLTVVEAVRMGRYASRGVLGRMTAQDRRIVRDAIDRMGLGELSHRQLHELSGGQRQRVLVAQGLAQQADLLLLDEPITGLDLVSHRTVTEAIEREKAAGRTIVLTTHDVETARTADQVVLLATRIVAAGPSAEVLVPERLAVAYGGHVHLLDDGTVVLDDPHHHAEPAQATD